MKLFLGFQVPNTIPLTSIISKVLQRSNLLSLFPRSTKTKHFSPPKDGYKKYFSQDLNQKLCLENKKPLMIWIRPFKEKEKEGGEGRSQLNGQWKVPMLGGPWRFHCLVAFKSSIAWWPLKGFNVWWPLKGSIVWWPMEGSIA